MAERMWALSGERDPNHITRGMASAPRNAWYVVAGVDEVGDSLLSRRVLDIPLVLFRAADGEPVALFDRCPHRLMPLSLGRKIDDEIQCGYHGIRFDRGGHCTLIPSQNSIPAQLRVASYPVVDKAPFTWVWLGDPGKADPALIPVPERIPEQYSTLFQLCYPIKADFLLLHENLMDTSHPTFLHAGYFDDGQLAGASMKVETEGNIVRLIRDVGVHIPGPGTTRFFGLQPGVAVHQTTVTETHAPSLNVIHYRFTEPGKPSQIHADFLVLAPITPSGPRECYHFVGAAAPFRLEPNAQADAVTKEIIAGDALALEAIEQRRDEMAAEDAEAHIRADGASLYLRRLIRSMAEAERV